MSSFQALIRKMPKPPKPTEAPEAVPVPPEDLEAVTQWLWDGSGRVPSAVDLQLELGNGGRGSPFHVRRRPPRQPAEPCRSTRVIVEHAALHRTQSVALYFAIWCRWQSCGP